MKEGNRIELSQIREDPDGAAMNLPTELTIRDLYADGSRLQNVYVCSQRAAEALDLFCQCPEPVNGFELPQDGEGLQALIQEHHLLRIKDSDGVVRLGIMSEQMKYLFGRILDHVGTLVRGIDVPVARR
jgi:hypothetical protein